MIHFIDGVLEPLLWFLADWSLRWAIVIVLFACWLVFFRPRRAASRYLVAWVVLLAGLLLPALPRWDTGLSGFAVQPVAGVAPVAPVATSKWDDLAPNTIDLRQPIEIEPVPAKRGGGETAVESPAPAIRPATPLSTPIHAESLGSKRIGILGLVLAWMAGMIFLLFRRLGGWLLLERMRRAALVVQGTPAKLFAACCLELGLRRRVTLATHSTVNSPITLGLFRPTILVPPQWPEFPETVQRGGLLHELAHLSRYDDWWALVLESVRVALFFHPLVRWLLVRLERERELLCDETAVARGIDPREYARVLMEFARQPGRLLPAAFVGPWYPVHFGNRRTVKARINRLLEANMYRWMSPLPARRAMLLIPGSLILALGVGSIRIGAASSGSDSGATQSPLSEAKSAAIEVLAMPGVWGEDQAESDKTLYRIRPFQALKIKGANVDPKNPIDDNYTVESDGKVNLGLGYRRVEIGGLTLEEAEKKIEKHLKEIGFKVPQISVSLAPLSYGGKAFTDWCTLLATDLKPEVRIEAMKALSAFGVSGHGKDAAAAIMECVRAYGAVHSDDRPVIEAARKALVRIGSDALPVLLGELKRGKTDARRFAAETFYYFNFSTSANQWRESVSPALIEATHDEDEAVRGWAFQRLVDSIDNKWLLEKDRRMVATASEFATSENPRNSEAALRFLAAVGPEAKEAVPALATMLKNPHLLVQSKRRITSILSGLGPEAKEAVPALVALLKDMKVRHRTDYQDIIEALGAIGPSAKGAVPTLTELLNQTTSPDQLRDQKLLRDALERINK